MITRGLQEPKWFRNRPGYHPEYWETEEGKGLILFHKMISELAALQNCAFFEEGIVSGEREECFENGVFYCSLCGWLIPFEKADEFEKDWLKSPLMPGDKWADYIRWGEWKRMPDGSIKVEINNYG